jgi:hypothetical protein
MPSQYLSKIHSQMIFAFFSVMSSAAACGASRAPALSLHADVKDGVLVARLKNVSSHSVRVLGDRQTPNPGLGGFYIEIRGAAGRPIQYCGMMDNEIPKVRWLRPGATIVYSNSLVGLRIQYCLQAGTYTGRVVYFDAMPLSGDTYSPPVHSNRCRFVVRGEFKN